MEHREIIEALQKLTDKQFVELFYEAVQGRHLYESEAAYCQAHLVLANAERHAENDGEWSEWRLQLLCPTPGEDWGDDAPICQFGHHCGHETGSWAKNSVCPMCGEGVYGT